MMVITEICRNLWVAVLMLSIPGEVFWPYFSGILVLCLGVATRTASAEFRAARGIENFALMAPVYFAVAVAVFGADHLTAARFVALIVPPWMPAKLFWAYFVGFALIAAALSLATNILSRIAATLLGIMILLFVLTIHLPNWMKTPGMNVQLTILLRDTALSAGALAFGISGRDREGQKQRRLKLEALAPRLIAACRVAIAVTLTVFGIDQLLNPNFAPGIPQENLAVFVAMPAWIPAHAFWGRLTGAIFVICALGILTRKYVRLAANVVGVTSLVLILFVYLPLTITKSADVANGLNYLAIHFALAGSAFSFHLPRRGLRT